ncbi:MAG: Holliday junction branch migration protein RuvA [bacterium JZ-2024 1]
MLQSICGKVLRIAPEGVELSIRDISILLLVPAHTLSKIREGEKRLFYTDLIVDETGIHLLGFLSERERELFRRLRHINGIGRKVALKMLQEGLEVLLYCLARGDEEFLLRFPGVGKKAVRKVMMELGEEVRKGKWGEIGEETTITLHIFQEAQRALRSLGLKQKETEQLLRKVEKSLSPPYSVELIIREALKMR